MLPIVCVVKCALIPAGRLSPPRSGDSVTSKGRVSRILHRLAFLFFAFLSSCNGQSCRQDNQIELYWLADSCVYSPEGYFWHNKEVQALPQNGDYIFAALDYSFEEKLLFVASKGNLAQYSDSKLLIFDPARNAVVQQIKIQVMAPVSLSVSPAGKKIAIIGKSKSDSGSVLYCYLRDLGRLEIVANGPFCDVSWDASGDKVYVSTDMSVHEILEFDLSKDDHSPKILADGIGVCGAKEPGTFFFVDRKARLWTGKAGCPTKSVSCNRNSLDEKYFSYLKYVRGSDDRLLVASFRVSSNEILLVNPTDGAICKVLDDCGAKDVVAWSRAQAQ